MQFTIRHFDIEEIGFELIATYEQIQSGLIQHSFRSKYVRGKQERINVREGHQTVHFTKPKNPIDYLKTWLISEIPSLNFGWLTPETTQDIRVIRYTEKCTYLNVMPVPKRLMPFQQTPRHLEMIERIGRTEFDEVDFLMSQPATTEEVREAKEDYNNHLYGRESALFFIN